MLRGASVDTRAQTAVEAARTTEDMSITSHFPEKIGITHTLAAVTQAADNCKSAIYSVVSAFKPEKSRRSRTATTRAGMVCRTHLNRVPLSLVILLQSSRSALRNITYS
jgi:hypothetical protein